MERKNKPAAIPVSPSMQQPTVDVSENVVTARLPSRDSVTINLYGATVTSWTLANGSEQLFLSSAAKLDGSKAIRGGIPVVFPVFGPPPKQHATGQLPQHGFARSTYWQFMGKSSSESAETKKGVDDTVKLDFSLSSQSLDATTKKRWPYAFALQFSVTLGPGLLGCQLHVLNEGNESWEFQSLFHTYFKINDISKSTIRGLQGSSYVDKTVSGTPTVTESAKDLTLTEETDRVYSPGPDPSGKAVPIGIFEAGKPKFKIERDSLPDVTVWNLWDQKASSMGDFEPKDGWKHMICVEPGAVSDWIKLEGGDAWEGSMRITAAE